MLSIAVPLHNEEDSVVPLATAVREAMEPWSRDWELILVDDGSRDGTARLAAAEAARDSRVRLVRLARNYGQSTAMQAGFDHARGDLVVTMDGDLQNDPRDIPRLVAALEAGGHDLVTGYRERRQDRVFTRKVPSWVANRLIRAVTGVPVRDVGCSLKVYRREVLDRVRLYSDMHRFIPALAATLAGASIAEIPVRHHARQYGKSKYGLSRIAAVLGDLLTIIMIRWFREQPLTLFGLAAATALTLAVLPAAAFVAKVAGYLESASLVVLSGVALCLVGLASFLFMLGLIAESMLRADHDTRALGRVIIRPVAP
ncbi:MAG TPA: glycosyltransferase family 2 protein [Longimicrobiales bacterium]|nr:glycosyltransferase family 2 protein [Longimicrobiales bacterium]